MTDTATPPSSSAHPAQNESPADPGQVAALGAVGSVRRAQVRDLFARLATPTVFLLIFGPIYGLWLGSTFLNAEGLMLVVFQNVPVMIIAVGLVFCLSAGQFDLSVASVTTLVVFLTIGLRVNQGLSFPLVLVIGLGVGLLCGLLNGFLVVKVKINAFIATLATGGVYGGISVVYGGGQQITQAPDRPRMPTWFSGVGSFGSFQKYAPVWLVAAALLVLVACVIVVVNEQWPAEKRTSRSWAWASVVTVLFAVIAVLGRGAMSVTPWEVLFLLLLVLGAWVVMRYTAFGRGLYAIGGNPTASRLSGIPVGRYTILAFVITGVFSALAGVTLAANQGTAVPGLGAGYLLPAYAAAFLSTVIISHGRFHVWGTVLGALSVVLIAHGLIIGGLPFTWNEVINGLVLGVAVAIATMLRGEDTVGGH